MNAIFGLVQRRIWIGLLIGLVVGIVLGLGIGWVIAPVNWQPNPDDVMAVAEAYDSTKDPVVARARLRNLPTAEQQRIINRLVQDQAAKGNSIAVGRLSNLAQVLNVAITPVPLANQPVGVPPGTGGATPLVGVTPGVGGATPAAGTAPVPTGVATRPLTSAPAGQSGFDVGGLVPILLIIVAFILIAAIMLIVLLRILPGMRARQSSHSATVEPTPAAAPAREGERRTPLVPSPPATTTPGGLGRFVPSYTLGNDNYDTSYSLETARGEFLGECGMGISETIGEGKPDKVVAFDLWLFDKADVRTVTQILMSEYAFKDQTLRTKLGTKGEAVLVEKGKTLRLETASLRVDAQISELVYATNGSYPPNSHFQKLIVEIVPSNKGDGAAH
jgi:hypothetical protein